GGRVRTLFAPGGVPRSPRGGRVIGAGPRGRGAGAWWEGWAGACTADGLVSPSVVRRWIRRFPDGLPAFQPAAPFRGQAETWTLGVPAGSRVPDPTQEDPWARSPPRQP